jgi:hypothetical protein
VQLSNAKLQVKHFGWQAGNKEKFKSKELEGFKVKILVLEKNIFWGGGDISL